MRLLITAIAVLMISGCTSRPAGPPPKIDPPAICLSKAQCDAMWAEAMVQAQNLSGMRLQTATDVFLQTFNPTDFGRMSAMARKMPLPNGTTAIEATFTCRFACGDLPVQAVNLFTAAMNRAGSSFAAPTAAPSAQAPLSPAQPMTEQAYKDAQIQQLMQKNLPYDEYQKQYRAIMDR